MYRFRLVLNKFLLPFIWLLLLGTCLIAPYFPEKVAQYYTNGLFRYGTTGLSSMFGRIPFAMGEFIYLIFIIILIINLIKYYNSLKIFNQKWQKLRYLLIRLSWLGIRLWIIFQLIWGLNYLQPGPIEAFQLSVQPPQNASIALEEINALTNTFIQALNQTKSELTQMGPQNMDFEILCTLVESAYSKDLHLKKQSSVYFKNLKKAVFPGWGDYMGYLAFYQPMTGEAIVRADLPAWTLPYTIAHEMAHQLGYASETEANFIAYIVATESGDPILRYSMLLQMFTYAQDAQLLLIAGNKGFDAWEAQIKKNKSLLSPEVLKDRASIRDFFAARSGKHIEASSKLYDQFLKWNHQASGLASYQDVLKWVRAYQIKTGSSTSYSQ